MYAADGIIHIESPVQRIQTLGNFFDIGSRERTTCPTGQRVRDGAVERSALRGGPTRIPLDGGDVRFSSTRLPPAAPEVIEFPSWPLRTLPAARLCSSGLPPSRTRWWRMEDRR